MSKFVEQYCEMQMLSNKENMTVQELIARVFGCDDKHVK